MKTVRRRSIERMKAKNYWRLVSEKAKLRAFIEYGT
jgi:hypothetical protein